jgi:hypothetical protein
VSLAALVIWEAKQVGGSSANKKLTLRSMRTGTAGMELASTML